MGSKISVIVPVYNVEQYLPVCLDSILGQTYSDLEIILVDDGSPDGSGAVCDGYGEKDARIRVIHQKNGGVSAARNAGLDAATGDYIAFVDGDDWLERDMYAYLMDLAETYGADVTQCGYFFDEPHGSEARYVVSESGPAEGAGKALTRNDWDNLSYANWNKLFRAETVKGLRFDPCYRFGEDFLYNVTVLQRTTRVCFGDAAKYHYIQRNDSVCHAVPSLEHLAQNRLAMEEAARIVQKTPAARRHLCKVLALETLDGCSKLVRFCGEESTQLKLSLRRYLRQNILSIVTDGRIPVKERLKSILAGFAWPVYRRLLLMSKEI